MNEDRVLGQSGGIGTAEDGPQASVIENDWYDAGGFTAVPASERGDGPADSDADSGDTGTRPDTAAREADQSFRLKYMGQELEVSKDELITLAQKGKDYDRIRSRADAMAEALRENSEYRAFLEELASRSGQSLEEFIGKTRQAMNLTVSGKPTMPSSPPADNNPPGARQSPTAETDAGAMSAAARRDRDIAEFLSEYGMVDPRAIPQEVWDAVRAGKSLLAAYQSYENKLLRAYIEAERKNRENRLKTAGSRYTAGATEPRGEIEDDWYNND